MAYNTTASLDKLTCTDYVDFGKWHDRFGRFSWSKNDSNYLDVKLKVFKKVQEQKRVPTGPKLYNGRGRFKPVYEIEESAGQCSRKLRLSGNFDPSTDNYNDQRHG